MTTVGGKPPTGSLLTTGGAIEARGSRRAVQFGEDDAAGSDLPARHSEAHSGRQGGALGPSIRIWYPGFCSGRHRSRTGKGAWGCIWRSVLGRTDSIRRLVIETDRGTTQIEVFNRAIQLFVLDDERIRSIHRLCETVRNAVRRPG